MPSVICFIHLHSEQRELTDERFMCFGGVMRPGNTQTNLHRVPYSPPCLSIFRSLPLLTLNISDCMWASEVIDTVVVYTLELWCKSDIQCLISKFCLFSWGEWKIYSEIRYTTRNYTSLEKQGENLHCLRKKSKNVTFSGSTDCQLGQNTSKDSIPKMCILSLWSSNYLLKTIKEFDKLKGVKNWRTPLNALLCKFCR